MLKEDKKRGAFEEGTELIGWIQIFLSLFIYNCVIALIIYNYSTSILNICISILLVLLGTFIGIKLANQKYRNKGTINFLSGTQTTSDLDEKQT